MKPLVFALLCGALGSVFVAEADVLIVQSRGVDSRVDYASLALYGPWDDRNYGLTQEDLSLLADNELEVKTVIPLFYRVQLRHTYPGMRTTGRIQYRHSELPRFFLNYGGFLVDGRLYRGLVRDGERIALDLENPWGRQETDGEGFEALTTNKKISTHPGNAESAVAIRPGNPNFMIAGSNDIDEGQVLHFSTNGGASWAENSIPLGDVCCDPTVAWSYDGSKAYAASLQNSAPGQVFVYRSANNGMGWTDLGAGDPRRELGVNADKEYLHVDTYSASPCRDNLYLTWHEGNTMKFSLSNDLANTWSTPQTHSNDAANEWGIGSDISSDKSGYVYHFWPAMDLKKILVRRSTNCGASFDPVVEVATTLGNFSFPVPAMETREVFIYAAAAADLTSGTYGGSIYAAWTDSTATTGSTPANNHGRIQVAYSRNAATTWAVTTPHETADANSVDRFHPWIAVGEDGTVHVIYYDTRNLPARTSVDVYWSTSTDGAQTWSTPKKLSTQASPNIIDGFEFGDYNGLDVIGNQLVAIFTDNRGGTPSVDSVSVYAAGAEAVPTPIFTDDFESGGVSNWSSSSP